MAESSKAYFSFNPLMLHVVYVSVMEALRKYGVSSLAEPAPYLVDDGC